MPFVFVDYETRGTYDPPLVGRERYFETAEVLMVGVGFEDGETVILPNLRALQQFEREDDPIHVVSWGDFDREVAARLEGITHYKWTNAADLARLCGLPGGLQRFCTAIGLSAEKDARGTRLINRYSKLQPDGSFLELRGDDLVAFQEYCLQDVVLLQQAWRFLKPVLPDWEKQHLAAHETYERMNRRGVPIDRVAAERALKMSLLQAEKIEEECFSRFGFKTTQTERVRSFLGTKDISKTTLEAFRPKSADQQWVRDARLTTAKAAAKKLVPMLDMSETDGRIRHSFQYHGAHTGRGSSHGVQFQNMKKARIDFDYFYRLHAEGLIEDPTGSAQRNIRGFIAAPPDRTFVIVDYAQVEARILSWIAGQESLTRAFVAGEDVYQAFAAAVYGLPLEEVTKSSPQRAHGKAAVLGCGYGMGPDRFIAQSAEQDPPLIIGEAQARKLVYGYREAYPRIPQLWYDIDMGVKELLLGREEEFSAGRCVFSVNKLRTMMKIRLPSGRFLRYFRPTLLADGEIAYTGRYGDKRCWGGHFVENICQAIAGDLKVDAMQRADRLGFSTIMEVHDELVIEEDRIEADSTLSAMRLVMATPPEWLDVDGLIVGEGFISDRFTK